MDTYTAWIALITVVILIIIIISTIWYFLLEKNPSPSPSVSTPSLSSSVLTPTMYQTPDKIFSHLPLTPAARSMPVDNCFSPQTTSANHVVSILLSNNLQSKYAPLILTYSIVLCAYTDSISKNCNNLQNYMNQIILLGGSPNSSSALTMLSYYTTIRHDSKAKGFLVATMDVINTYAAMLVNENVLSESDRKAIKGFNYEFCRNYFDQINQVC
uniref:Uncharacterized protein n=1 Tax=viral metagenome TaxID=1070528 RepID=A0A6C0BG67_9ZZZZ